MSTPAHLVSMPRAMSEEDERVTTNLIVSTLLLVLTTFFVMLRWAARRMKDLWGAEDWFCVAALVANLAGAALNYIQISNGLGRHVEFVSLHQQVIVLQCLLALELLYNVIMLLAKFSFVFLYLRLFPFIKTQTYVVAGFVISWAVAFTFVLLFQCQPINKFWSPGTAGTCLDPRPIFVSNAALNFASDMALLCLPIAQVVKLEVKIAVKVSVCSIFVLGGFVSFAGLYRIKTLLAVDPTDTTWTFVDSNIWTIIETSGAVISSCLPTLRPLLAKVSATFSSLTTRRSTNTSRLHQLKSQKQVVRDRIDSNSTMDLPIYNPATNSVVPRRDLDELVWQRTREEESEPSHIEKGGATKTIVYDL